MQPILHIILSDGAAKAVCWTLVHSIWQGIAAALVAGTIILCTRKRAAALRYNLLTAVLLLFVSGTAFTFCNELSRTASPALLGSAASPDSPELAAITQSPVPAKSTGPTLSPATARSTGDPASASIASPETSSSVSATPALLQRTESYLNTHAPMITLIWLICLAAQLARLSGGLYRIDMLRKGGMAPDALWAERLAALTHRLGIKRTVVLLQSGKIHAPSAIGFL
ncbi:MAG TPA: hypothetical protein VHI52_03975, partial [Verrucomicrobiae bacterium]|nr:hypothetical protein [Verrucomicrobiae bacterium]